MFIAQVVDPSIGPARAVELRSRRDEVADDYVPTIEEALTLHLDEMTGVDERTPRDYVAMAKRTWLPVLGSLPVDAITKADVARWLRVEEGRISPKSIANAHALLSGVMSSAVERGQATANPAYKTRLTRTGEDATEENRYLTPAEFDTLWGEMPEHYQPMVNLLFGTGLRYSEATALRVGDLSLDGAEPSLRVVRAWKGRNSDRLGPPKSVASRRTVTLPRETVDAILPLTEQAGDQLLFQSATGKPVRHNNFYNRIWRPATIRASICLEHRDPKCLCGTPKPLLCPVHVELTPKGARIPAAPCGCAGTVSPRPRIHDARHTHASWLINQGVRLEVVRDRLGHDDLQTTIRVYAHLMPGARLEAAHAASQAFATTALATSPPTALPAAHPAAS